MKPDLSHDFRRLNVDPRLWAWHRSDYPAATSEWAIQPEMVIAHYQRAAGGPTSGRQRWSIAGILWASFVGFGHLVTAHFEPTTGSWAEILAGMALSFTVLYLARTPAGKLTLGQVATLLAFTFFTTIGIGPFYLGVMPVAVIYVVKMVTRRRAYDAAARTQVTGPGFPLPCMVFGDPGGVSKAANRYGTGRVAAGAQGEASTAILLKLLLEIPGTTVFHGLRFPGSHQADVDHAVVHGNMVILIDSKQFRGGTYSWVSGRNTIADTANHRQYDNHMDSAMDGYYRILGGEARVHAVVMIHGKAVVVHGRPESNGVLLATAHDAMDHIGTLVASDLHTGGAGFDNSKIIGLLLLNVK